MNICKKSFFQKFFYMVIIIISLGVLTEVSALENDEQVILSETEVLESIISDTDIIMNSDDEVEVVDTIIDIGDLVEEEIGLEEILEENLEDDTNIDESLDKPSIEENIPVEEETVEISREEFLTSISKNLEFKENIVNVINIGFEGMSVIEFLGQIDMEQLISKYMVDRVVITDLEDVFLTDNDMVHSGYHLVFLGTEFIFQYKIQLLGDLNCDDMVNEEDITHGMDAIIFPKEEIEHNVSVEDISYVDAVISNGGYEVASPVEEEIHHTFEVVENKDIYVNDTVLVQYKVDGLVENYINTIYGNLEYNRELLELGDIYLLVEGKVIGRVEKEKFIYLFPETKTKEVVLLFVFKSLNEGSGQISFKELKVCMNGVCLLDRVEDKYKFDILKYGIGGNPEEIEDINSGSIGKEENASQIQNKPTNLEINVRPGVNSNIKKEVVFLNEDNYIEKLEISGYDISFNRDIFYYDVIVDNSVMSLDMDVLLSDDNSFYKVVGNEDLKEGVNEVILMVYAENGGRRDYIINVNKMEKNKEDNVMVDDNEDKLITKKAKIKFEKGMPFITFLIVVVLIIGVLYFLFKEED